MNTPEALHALGVRDDTLTQAERDRLDTDGFLPLPGILTPQQVAAITSRLAALLKDEGEHAGKEVHQEAGTNRLSDLVNKDPIFAICFTHPRVLAGIAHVLSNDLKLSSLNSRAALSGEGLQALHADWGQPVAPGDYQVCNSIWLLDDFTETSGPAGFAPAPPRGGGLPRDAMKDPKPPHQNEQMLLAPAGTVVIFNSHVWHGGTRNSTDRPRRA